MTARPARSVLISGASIAGPVVAYWLTRHGFTVTVVEKATTVRGGGYPIDVRGTALDVLDRMGLLPRVRAAHVDVRRVGFVDRDGDQVGSIRPEDITGGRRGRDVELPRGDLTAALYDAVRDDVEFLFDDSITSLDDTADGVDVTFRGGPPRTFDLVIGADGLHSATRGLVLGPEAPFHRYLGYCFAGFTMPNVLGLSHEGLTYNTPGRAAVMYAPGDTDRVHGFLNFSRATPPFAAFADPAAQIDLVAAAFADARWEVPRMVAAMREADDLFFDVVSQIHLPRWSSGRVAFVGDAACAPSFLSGQGTSVALVGAYVLAGELAGNPDHTKAFAAYENATRPFATLNQALAKSGGSTVAPATALALWTRNQALRAAPLLARTGFFGRKAARATTAMTLPDYRPGTTAGRL